MRPHPILKKMDDLYSELTEEVESLERKKNQLEEVLGSRTTELERLQSTIQTESKAIEEERKTLKNEKADFEDFRTETLAQMETIRKKLEKDKKEFEAARIEAKSSIEIDRRDLAEKIQLFEAESEDRHSQLQQLAAQLDEERSEFDSYRTTSQTQIRSGLEANDLERKQLEEQTAEFKLEQKNFKLLCEDTELAAQRAKAQLEREREAFTRQVAEFERVSELERARQLADQQHLEERGAELERLQADLLNQKWQLEKSRRLHEDERKQLARLLLGMGEKIGTNDIGAAGPELSGGLDPYSASPPHSALSARSLNSAPLHAFRPCPATTTPAAGRKEPGGGQTP